MTAEETKQLAGLWLMYAAYYRTKLDDQVLKMYAEDLADLDYSAVNSALQSYRRDPRNRVMPLPSMIRDLLQPKVDAEAQAREVAARIQGAVVKFGWPNPTEARAYIGESGWRIVETRGGWSHLCQNLGTTIDPTAFEAQVREQAKADIKYGPSLGVALGLAPGAKRGELQSIGEIMQALPLREET